MKNQYEAVAFHWSYPIRILLIPISVIMWVCAKLSGANAKPFMEGMKASLFNKHTCEFHSEVIDNSYRKCKNELCNMATILNEDGTWIDDFLRELDKEQQK